MLALRVLRVLSHERSGGGHLTNLIHDTAAPGEPLEPVASYHVGLGIGAVGTAPALQERGSHGASFDVVGLGVAIAPEVDGVDVIGVDVDGVAAVGLVGLEGGALTANWVPVTTVT